MPKINLCFGYPICPDQRSDIGLGALNHGIPFEDSAIMGFGAIIRSLNSRDDKPNYFDRFFTLRFKKIVQAPNIKASLHTEGGIKLPMMTLESNYVLHLSSGEKCEITTGMLQELGKLLEEDFGFEFID